MFRLANWLQSLRRSVGPARKTTALTKPRSYQPLLEALEDRTVMSTLTVLNSLDSGPGSLRAKIAAASSGDTIVFAPSVHAITLTSGELNIAANIYIVGPGANHLSISGNNASRVFEIGSGLNVTIDGLKIAHGHAADEGGGILNDGSNLTLSGDVLSSNVAVEVSGNGAFGGGLQSLDGALIISDCQITGNEVFGGAGAAANGSAGGAGIDMVAGSATITNTTISGNLAQGGDNSSGGSAFGAAIGGDPGLPVTISNCIISNNHDVGGNNTPFGAGQAAVELEGPTAISNTIFSGNITVGGNGGTGGFVGEAEGGALAVFGPNGGGSSSTITISGCAFDHNQAIGGNGGNSGPGQSDPGVDESYGAGIFNFGDIINVSAPTFTHNTSIGGNNGSATGTDIVEVGVAEGAPFAVKSEEPRLSLAVPSTKMTLSAATATPAAAPSFMPALVSAQASSPASAASTPLSVRRPSPSATAPSPTTHLRAATTTPVQPAWKAWSAPASARES